MKVLLYSNGLDSAALRFLWKPDVCLYVDLGNSYSQQELALLDREVQVVKFPGLAPFERPDKIIPLRNLMLVCLAAQFGDEIALAATKGDRVLDKSYEFAEQSSKLLSFLWQKQWWTEGKNIRVVLPVKDLTKTQLVRKYKEEGGDLNYLARTSFSCYNPKPEGRERECWLCKPCFRKWVAFKNNGYDISFEIHDHIRRGRIEELENYKCPQDRIPMARSLEYAEVLDAIRKIV